MIKLLRIRLEYTATGGVVNSCPLTSFVLARLKTSRNKISKQKQNI